MPSIPEMTNFWMESFYAMQDIFNDEMDAKTRMDKAVEQIYEKNQELR